MLAFSVVNVNDEHMKPRFKHVYLHGSKESEGVKFKKSICVELCLKLWFESDWYFCKITESEWF